MEELTTVATGNLRYWKMKFNFPIPCREAVEGSSF